ncbi:SUMF1/EgtB/PvdO family nonheme iron enzyme [uncultured Fusobacterium sp.]|uniref:SUMF1/EgtB/PvdO family nonheme iron enzyme n=1 Tax=uncultured Fusobacterium sp. TaxID=159267 RepID=UPI0025EFF0F1|nr:SUMF1/EgtB/PvdO family nonheme iron enzyme [uncultured Fusobacterium sp.]
MGKGNQIVTYTDAKRPILYINHYDYKEIDKMIEEGAKKIGDVKIFEYRSIGEVDFKTKEVLKEEKGDLFKFLDKNYVQGMFGKVFLVLKDVDKEIENSEVLAMIKKIAEMTVYNLDYNLSIIIVSQNIQVPKELENYISIVEIPKLDRDEIEEYIKEVANERGIKINQDDLGEIAISLKGLSKWYITQILNMMDIVSTSNIQKIIKEKGQIIKKSGILELIDFKEKISDIGGLENLKEWLDNKAKVFRRLDEAKKFGVDTPKGLMLVGMPGCGKSLTAKVASRMFNVPLLRLDIGRLLGKYVGESEHNLRMALKMSESISPCILWIDEIEKAFAGIDQSGGASDITKRLFGQFLTWLQEKENTVFVVATANDISSFPPEFLRKGRFDEIFYVDFPNRDEREEIFRIHLEKRGKYNEELIDLGKLAGLTDGFCGADIEEAVKIAVEDLFLSDDEDKTMDTDDVIDGIKKIDSMKSIIEEKIEALQKAYEKFKLKPASLKEGQKKVVRKKAHKKGKVSGNIQNDDKDMVFVQGGRYTPSFFNEERSVHDLFVSKYQTTQIRWKEIMGTDPSKFKGDRRPAENISWIEALEYCNKLSEHYEFKPVYKIQEGKLVAIIYNDGEEVYPDLADFSKTEGYRLPTELEWEWFARGGEIAIQDGTFDFEYSGSNNINEVAWNDINSGKQTHTVGTKKPNQLGLYDCSGNIWEWCYDTNGDGYILEERAFIYDESIKGKRLKGGSHYNDKEWCRIVQHSAYSENTNDGIGFRVVRTA